MSETEKKKIDETGQISRTPEYGYKYGINAVVFLFDHGSSTAAGIPEAEAEMVRVTVLGDLSSKPIWRSSPISPVGQTMARLSIAATLI
jgi:hypothetical protein